MACCEAVHVERFSNLPSGHGNGARETAGILSAGNATSRTSSGGVVGGVEQSVVFALSNTPVHFSSRARVPNPHPNSNPGPLFSNPIEEGEEEEGERDDQRQQQQPLRFGVLTPLHVGKKSVGRTSSRASSSGIADGADASAGGDRTTAGAFSAEARAGERGRERERERDGGRSAQAQASERAGVLSQPSPQQQQQQGGEWSASGPGTGSLGGGVGMGTDGTPVLTQVWPACCGFGVVSLSLESPRVVV